MAVRNMIKTSESITGKIPDRYDLTVSEMNQLIDIARKDYNEGLWDALSIAFKYGFVLGGRSKDSEYSKKANVANESV